MNREVQQEAPISAVAKGFESWLSILQVAFYHRV
jgi:hypothetical protein